MEKNGDQRSEKIFKRKNRDEPSHLVDLFSFLDT